MVDGVKDAPEETNEGIHSMIRDLPYDVHKMISELKREWDQGLDEKPHYNCRITAKTTDAMTTRVPRTMTAMAIPQRICMWRNAPDSVNPLVNATLVQYTISLPPGDLSVRRSATGLASA